jgi:hypothetical protein
VTTSMLSMAAASEFVLEPIRDSAECTLYWAAKPLALKPGTELVAPEPHGDASSGVAGCVWLTGVGIAFRQPRERHPLPPANSGRSVEGRSSVDSVLIRFVFKPQPWPPIFSVEIGTIGGRRFLTSHSTGENADG